MDCGTLEPSVLFAPDTHLPAIPNDLIAYYVDEHELGTFFSRSPRTPPVELLADRPLSKLPEREN